MRLCGYSAGRPFAEVWEILLLGPASAELTQVHGKQEFGIRSDDANFRYNRLTFRIGAGFEDGQSLKDSSERKPASCIQGSPLLCSRFFRWSHSHTRYFRVGTLPRTNDNRFFKSSSRAPKPSGAQWQSLPLLSGSFLTDRLTEQLSSRGLMSARGSHYCAKRQQGYTTPTSSRSTELSISSAWWRVASAHSY